MVARWSFRNLWWYIILSWASETVDNASSSDELQKPLMKHHLHLSVSLRNLARNASPWCHAVSPFFFFKSVQPGSVISWICSALCFTILGHRRLWNDNNRIRITTLTLYLTEILISTPSLPFPSPSENMKAPFRYENMACIFILKLFVLSSDFGVCLRKSKELVAVPYHVFLTYTCMFCIRGVHWQLEVRGDWLNTRYN